MGKLRASWTARTMSEEGCQAILLTGFAGGIAGLKKGDVVVATKVYEGDYNTTPLEEYPNSIECEPLPIRDSMQAEFVSQDRFLTQDVYLEDAHHFKFSCSGSGVATDMESYAVAFAGRSLALPVFIVKIISDLVDNESEKDFLSACSKMSGRLNEVIGEAVNMIRKKVK